MGRKKIQSYFLQHSYPWDSIWQDVEKSDVSYCEEFHEVLKYEPDHVVELEYRVIKKERKYLKSKEKISFIPIPILFSKELKNTVNSFRV